ncbi:hypothetical protein D3C71_1526170 [compost metagenome]
MAAVQPFKLSGGEDLAHQPLGALVIQQAFLIQAQASAITFASHHGGGPTLAVGDRTVDAGGPDGRAIFVGAGHLVATIQALQRGAGADAPCQVFGLALGNRALQAGARHDAGTLEVVGGQLGRIEGATDQHRARQWAGQGPVVLERGAAGGECVHGGYCASD